MELLPHQQRLAELNAHLLGMGRTSGVGPSAAIEMGERITRALETLEGLLNTPAEHRAETAIVLRIFANSRRNLVDRGVLEDLTNRRMLQVAATLAPEGG